MARDKKPGHGNSLSWLSFLILGTTDLVGIMVALDISETLRGRLRGEPDEDEPTSHNS